MTKNAERVKKEIAALDEVRGQIRKVIVGQEDVLEQILLALLCEGHVLIEGVPGLGKTMMVKALGESLNLAFARIQFTPDLMPADILGTSMAVQNSRGGFDLEFERGPIFTNLLLADEINRASPKTQAALLEAMQERSVTVRGAKHPLPRPFLVLATQNPLEMEGTYPLPEAQIDRFFLKILISHPSEEELVAILDRTVGPESQSCQPVLDAEQISALQRSVREVVVPPQVAVYAARLVMATQPERPDSLPRVRQFVRYGAGPRGAQSLLLAGKARALVSGRFNVSLDDLRALAGPALRHRVALNFDGLSENVDVDELLREVVKDMDGRFAAAKEAL